MVLSVFHCSCTLLTMEFVLSSFLESSRTTFFCLFNQFDFPRQLVGQTSLSLSHALRIYSNANSSDRAPRRQMVTIFFLHFWRRFPRRCCVVFSSFQLAFNVAYSSIFFTWATPCSASLVVDDDYYEFRRVTHAEIPFFRMPLHSKKSVRPFFLSWLYLANFDMLVRFIIPTRFVKESQLSLTTSGKKQNKTIRHFLFILTAEPNAVLLQSPTS